MASYTGSFYATDTSKYDVEITGATHADNLTFEGEQPFEVDIEGTDDIYKPLKKSLATIRIVTMGIHADLFTASPMEHKVLLRKGGKLLWAGYLVPAVYNNSFGNNLWDHIELNARDEISVLEDYSFREFLDTYHIPFETRSFWKILHPMITHYCPEIEYLYVSKNLRFGMTQTAPSYNLLDGLYLNTTLFEDNEDTTCEEVLSSIAKYLNMTAVQSGNGLYFVDYDASGNTAGEYWRYSISSPQSIDSSTVTPRTIRIEDGYTPTSTISTPTVYKDIIYTADYGSGYEITDRLYDEELQTKGTEQIETIHRGNDDFRVRTTFIDTSYGQPICYSLTTHSVSVPGKLAFFDTSYVSGGALVKSAGSVDVLPDTSWLADTMVFVHNADSSTSIQREAYRVLDVAPQCYGDDGYLCVYFERMNTKYIVNDTSVKPEEHYRTVADKFKSVPVRLSITDGIDGTTYYFDASNNRWTTTQKSFRIPLEIDDNTSLLYQWTGAGKNNGLQGVPSGMEYKGFLCPLYDSLGSGRILNGIVKLVFLTDGGENASSYPKYQWYRAISLTHVSNFQNGTSTEFSDSSNFYGVSTYTDKNTVSTYNNTPAGSSSPMRFYNNVLQYVGYLYKDNEHDEKLPEVLKTSALSTQYCSHRLEVSTEIQNTTFRPFDRFTWRKLNGKTFLLASAKIDYASGHSNVHLIEHV